MSETASTPPKVVNRLKAVLLHIPFYSIESIARLAMDTGFSKATISRLASQKNSPSYLTTESIARAISRRSKIEIDPREIFSSDGTYPTRSACEVMGCDGCFPPEAWDEDADTLKPEFRHQKPGEWSRLQADPTPPGPTI